LLQKARKLSQILFLFFFIYLFIRARYPYDGFLPLDIGLRFSPLLPLFTFIKDLQLSILFWPALIILFFTLFFGRFFCGWICPLGTTLDFASRLFQSPSNKISQKWEKLRYLKFALLSGFILLAVFSIHIWGYLDPLSIFNRALTILLYPLATLGSETALLTLPNLSFIEDPAYSIYDTFKLFLMPEAQAFYQQVLWIGLFFAALIGLEKLSRRFWCRYLCPAGALLGFLSQFRFFERVVGQSCPSCGICHSECKMNAIPETDVNLSSKVECIECFSCAEVCPPKTKSISYQWRWKPYHSKVDFERRQFIKTSGISLAAIGLLSIGLKDRSKQDRLIRPPGSIPEADFKDRCIRCMECVRICESNGGCLQPDSIHSDLLELWLPVAVMREGYCEYNCNMCGEVCPTEAILPLSLTAKQQTPMGLAFFDKNTCIPFAQNDDCIVCEEHCPLPDKAIKFEEKEIILPNGLTKKIKYPYVIRELCIGCGICETKCPLVGAPGIFINIENQQRPQTIS